MDNIYILYGLEDFLIEKKINDIIEKYNVESDNIIKYNLDEVNVSNAIEEACMVSMFSNNKLIICEGCTFLTGENKKEVNHDIELLSKYIEKPIEDAFLVFVVRREKLDDRKKIVKELKKNSKVIECPKQEGHELNKYIEDYINKNGFKIDKKALQILIERSSYNLLKIINECEKIFIYKCDDKTITKEDVESLVFKNLTDNIFELTNGIMNKDKKKIMDIYKDLSLMGEEPIKLITLVANQFRLILQVKLMIKNGYKEREMASIIGEHPYRVKLAFSANFTIKKLKEYLIKLEELDYKIKSGQIDKNFGLELFLLNI